MVTRTRMTLEEFLALPGIDEQRLELIDGEVCEKMSPRWGHGEIVGELYFHLRPFGFGAVEPRAIIPGSDAGQGSAPLPDFAFYRADPPGAMDWMRRPPDLVAEVLSPGQSAGSTAAKVALYRAFGVGTVLVIDPEQETIERHEAGGTTTFGLEETLVVSGVPGFSVPVRELLHRPGRPQ